MKVIEFGNMSWYLLLTVIAPFFSCSRPFIVFRLTQHSFEGHPFVFLFLMFLAELIGGSLQIVICIRQHRKSKQKEPSMKPSQRAIRTVAPFVKLEEHQARKMPTINYLSFLGLAFLDLFGMALVLVISSLLTNHYLTHLEFQIKSCQMILSGLMSIKILRYPIHKHQVVSIVIIAGGVFFISLDTFIAEITNRKLGIKLAVLILSYAAYAFEAVYEKYLMEFKYVSPFNILIFKGLFGMMICIILFVIFSYVPCPENASFCTGKYIEDILKTLQLISKDKQIILFLSLYGFNCLMYNVLTEMIIMIYNPTYQAISDTIAALFLEGILLLNQILPVNLMLLLHLVGYIIMGIGTLIYNEIVIVHLCELSDYTHKEISRRAAEDADIKRNSSGIDFNMMMLINE